MQKIEVKVGDWVLHDTVIRNMFSIPALVTKISGSRVYLSRPSDKREYYKSAEAIKHVVPSEEVGKACWDEQWRLKKIADAERAETDRREAIQLRDFVERAKNYPIS
jgi:hypothetical protein